MFQSTFFHAPFRINNNLRFVMINMDRARQKDGKEQNSEESRHTGVRSRVEEDWTTLALVYGGMFKSLE